MRGWGPDGRTMLAFLRPSATGSGAAKAHNAIVRGVAYEREDELLESFSRAARGLLEDGSLGEALDRLAEAAAGATGSDLVIVRTIALDDGCLVARAVRADSSALAAELEGSRLSLDGLEAEKLESFASSSDEGVPDAIRNVCSRARAETIGIHPARLGDRIVATLELYRTGDRPFEERQRMLGRLAAAGQPHLRRRTVGASAGVYGVGPPRSAARRPRALRRRKGRPAWSAKR